MKKLSIVLLGCGMLLSSCVWNEPLSSEPLVSERLVEQSVNSDEYICSITIDNGDYKQDYSVTLAYAQPVDSTLNTVFIERDDFSIEKTEDGKQVQVKASVKDGILKEGLCCERMVYVDDMVIPVCWYEERAYLYSGVEFPYLKTGVEILPLKVTRLEDEPQDDGRLFECYRLDCSAEVASGYNAPKISTTSVVVKLVRYPIVFNPPTVEPWEPGN